jgi:hypothetical protein
MLQFLNQMSLYQQMFGKKKKVHFTLEQAMKAQRGVRGIDLLFP